LVDQGGFVVPCRLLYGDSLGIFQQTVSGLVEKVEGPLLVLLEF
jgi:hypothetical protein